MPSRADECLRFVAFARDEPDGDDSFAGGRWNQEVMRSASHGFCRSFPDDRAMRGSQYDYPREANKSRGGRTQHKEVNTPDAKNKIKGIDAAASTAAPTGLSQSDRWFFCRAPLHSPPAGPAPLLRKVHVPMRCGAVRCHHLYTRHRLLSPILSARTASTRAASSCTTAPKIVRGVDFLLRSKPQQDTLGASTQRTSLCRVDQSTASDGPSFTACGYHRGPRC